MKTPSQKLLEKFGAKDPEPKIEATPVEKQNGRRGFLKKSALGGMMLGGFMYSSAEDTLAQSTSKVNRNSLPSDLKITDMRYAVVMNGHARCPVTGSYKQEFPGGRLRDGVPIAMPWYE